MPKKAKKPASKQKRNVISRVTNPSKGINVRVNIDQSRRTTGRQPRAPVNKGLPGRGYIANSSTPLHTTIMTPTPSPAIIQQEPNYAETIKTLFKEADQRQTNQLALLGNVLGQSQQTQTLPTTKELYKLLMKEHMDAGVEELPDEIATEGVAGFEDPNAKTKSKLTKGIAQVSRPSGMKTPAKPQPEAVEWVDETHQETLQPKKKGRKPDPPEVKAAKAAEKALKTAMKSEAKKQLQYERLKKVANTRANQVAGLASPLAPIFTPTKPSSMDGAGATTELQTSKIPRYKKMTSSQFSDLATKTLNELVYG